jgi:hypothetical protein
MYNESSNIAVVEIPSLKLVQYITLGWFTFPIFIKCFNPSSSFWKIIFQINVMQNFRLVGAREKVQPAVKHCWINSNFVHLSLCAQSGFLINYMNIKIPASQKRSKPLLITPSSERKKKSNKTNNKPHRKKNKNEPNWLRKPNKIK